MTNLLNINDQGIAIQGYDPLTYFSEQPTLGNAQLTSTYEGATYYFVSEANKSKFDTAPEQYIPQYGGFCAVAISEGKTFPIDPNTYKVSDDKLYLFYNGKLGNTKPMWDGDEANRRANADKYWQTGDLKVVYPNIAY